MRIAVSTYSLSRWMNERQKSVEDALRWIAAAGVEGVEFVGIGPDGGDAIARAKTLRALCAELKLTVAGYCVGGEFLCEGEAQRKVIDDTRRHVDIAAALGAKNMRHDVTWGPKDPAATPFESVLKTIAPAVRAVTEHGARVGVRTSVENHGFYLQTAERVVKLVEAVGHPNFGLTVDLGNFMCLDQDPIASVQRAAPHAVMVHAKDFHVRPKADLPLPGWFATPTAIGLRGAILGHGAIDTKRQLAVLRDAGYRGFVSLEFEGIEDPEMAIRHGLEWLRARLGAEQGATAKT